MVRYIDLPDDDYTLRLVSGDGAFEDPVGLDLDGEALSFPLPPNGTGDGIEGGDFVVTFGVDRDIDALPVPLSPRGPLGNRVYESSVYGQINPAQDKDTYTIELNEGQSIPVGSFFETGTNARIRLIDSNGNSIAEDTNNGDPGAVIQIVEIESQDVYSIEVEGTDGSPGSYTDLRLGPSTTSRLKLKCKRPPVHFSFPIQAPKPMVVTAELPSLQLRTDPTSFASDEQTEVANTFCITK